MQDIQQQAAICTACKLCENRSLPFWGIQEDAPKFLFLADTPITNGRELEMLRTWIKDAGMAGECYITSIVKCPTPHGRAPFSDEMAQCWRFLDPQIAKIDPCAIVLLGKAAIDWLHPYDAVQSIRDVLGIIVEDGDISFVGMYAPSFILRQPEPLKKEMIENAVSILEGLREKVYA